MTVTASFPNIVKQFFTAAVMFYALSLPISMSATNFALALILAAVCAKFFAERELGGLPVSVYFLAIFFLWAVVSGAIVRHDFAAGDLRGFSKIWNFLPYLLIPAGAMFTSSKLPRILKLLVSVGCAVSVLGLLQYSAGLHYFFEGWFGSEPLIVENRFCGFQSHPLHSGALYTMLFLTSVSQALFYRSYPVSSVVDKGNAVSPYSERIFWLLASAILLGAIAITGSRSYYVACAVGLFVVLALRGWKTLLVGVLIFAGAVVWMRSRSLYVNERVRTINPLHLDEAGQQRVFMWKSALSMIKDHPVTGVGYRRWGQSLAEYSRRFPEWQVDISAYGHAHNSLLTVTAETGLVGLLLFVLFWLCLFKEIVVQLAADWGRGTFSMALTVGALANLAALFTASVTEHNLLTATVTLAFFFIWGLARSARLVELGRSA